MYIGSDDLQGTTDEVVNIEKPHDQTTAVDQIGKKDTIEKAVPLPKTVDEVGALSRVRNLQPPNRLNRRNQSSVDLKTPKPRVTKECE